MIDLSSSTFLDTFSVLLFLLSLFHLVVFLLKRRKEYLIGWMAFFIAAMGLQFRYLWIPARTGTESTKSGRDGGGQAVWQTVTEWWPAVWPWLVGVVAVILGGYVAVRLLAPRLRSVADLRAERVARAAAGQQRLQVCLSRWERIRDAYGALLMDPVRSLELQAVFDLQVEPSRAFHQAWTSFDDLARQVQLLAPAAVAESTLDRLEVRASDTENLWEAAQRYAGRIGWSNLAAVDQPKAARALTLLRTAHSDSATAGERDNAWALAAKVLAALNLAHLPEPAVAAVQAHARPSLARGAEA